MILVPRPRDPPCEMDHFCLTETKPVQLLERATYQWDRYLRSGAECEIEVSL